MEIGKIISKLRNEKGLNQRDFAKFLGVSSGAIGMWETGKRQPDLDTVKKMAAFFNVPTDYLLGEGVFENWDLLLQNKESIITQISIMASRLSSDILNGMDNMTFARLTYAFDVHVYQHEDGTIGITAQDPIPSYPTLVSIEKHDPLSDQERLISIFNSLSQDDRVILLGKALDLKRSSVAADDLLKKTGTNHSKK